MLAAILFSGLLLTSCSVDVPDNPVEDPGQPSAVDPGKWTIDDSFVDNSVKPGDDFFMHRNGKWWAATTIDDNAELPNTEGFLEDIIRSVYRQTNEPPKSGLVLKDHLEALVDYNRTEAMTENGVNYANRVYMDCGYPQACQEAVEQDDATPMWKAMGRMMAKGAPVPFSLEFFTYQGKVILFLGGKNSALPYDPSSIFPNLRREGEFVKTLTPLMATSGTRGIGGSKWPHLVAMIKEAGIDPADVYLASESTSFLSMTPEVETALNKEAKFIKDLHDCPPIQLAIELQEYANTESLIESKGSYDAVVAQYAKANITLDISSIYNFYFNKYMQYEVSHNVAEKFVTPEMRQAGIDHCKTVISVFTDRIKASKWLSEEGKKAVLEKLDNMAINVGCPEKWITEAIPDLSKSQSVVEDVFLLRKANFNFVKYVAGKSVKDMSFHLYLSPASENPLSDMNAFYNRVCNSINIYPWFLRVPLYDTAQNQAINYANLFETVGHEITHGFDSEGCKFDKFGDRADLFTNPADKAAFEQLSKKLVDRFNELDIMVIPGEKSHGEYCLVENIADLGGMEIAFDAYTRYLENSGFKGEEKARQQARFFSAYAEFYRQKYGPNFVKSFLYGDPAKNTKPDTHSLNRERVNGIVRNVDAWYDLFGVKPGDKLYLAPADRVHIW